MTLISYCPPLLEKNEICWDLALCVSGFFIWRIINRIIFVYQMYGLLHALLSPLRIIYGNFINFFATVRAVYWFIKSLITKKEPGWLKTEHEFPTDQDLQIFKRKIGDLFVENHMITSNQLKTALKEQKRTGKMLGKILLEKGHIIEEELASTLAIQNNLPYTEIDPFNVSHELLSLIPKEMAEKNRIFPLNKENNVLKIATDRLDVGDIESYLKKELDYTFMFYFTTKYDMQFALKRAYSSSFRQTTLGSRLGEKLIKNREITKDQLNAALREQKRTDKPLGEILVLNKIISRKTLDTYLENNA